MNFVDKDEPTKVYIPIHPCKIYRQTENMIHIKADQNLKNHYFLRSFPFLNTKSPLVLI